MTSTTSEGAASDRPRPTRRGGLELIAVGLREMLGRRRLIRYLVGADLKRTHADTVIGQLWWIVDPVLQMAVYAVLVTIIFQRGTPDFPLFLFAAILPWKWFSTTLSDATTSITSRNTLIRQIQFPKIVLPAAATISGTVSFGFGLVALAGLYVFYLHRLSPWLLALPIVAGVQFVFTLALGVACAAVNAFYRDVQNVLRHALRLWFYLSPALYAIDHIPEGPVRTILSYNPFAVLLTSYRTIVWGRLDAGTRAPDFLGLAVLLGASLLLLVAALYLFKRVEPAFARIL